MSLGARNSHNNRPSQSKKIVAIVFLWNVSWCGFFSRGSPLCTHWELSAFVLVSKVDIHVLSPVMIDLMKASGSSCAHTLSMLSCDTTILVHFCTSLSSLGTNLQHFLAITKSFLSAFLTTQKDKPVLLMMSQTLRRGSSCTSPAIIAMFLSTCCDLGLPGLGLSFVFSCPFLNHLCQTLTWVLLMVSCLNTSLRACHDSVSVLPDFTMNFSEICCSACLCKPGLARNKNNVMKTRNMLSKVKILKHTVMATQN